MHILLKYLICITSMFSFIVILEKATIKNVLIKSLVSLNQKKYITHNIRMFVSTYLDSEKGFDGVYFKWKGLSPSAFP